MKKIAAAVLLTGLTLSIHAAETPAAPQAQGNTVTQEIQIKKPEPTDAQAVARRKIVEQLKTAHQLRRQGIPNAAREIFIHVLNDPAATPHLKSEAQVWLGHLHRIQGEWEQANIAYGKVFFIPGANPHHHSEAHVCMGQIYYALGKYREAKREFKTVLRMEARVPDHLRIAKERLQMIN